MQIGSKWISLFTYFTALWRHRPVLLACMHVLVCNYNVGHVSYMHWNDFFPSIFSVGSARSWLRPYAADIDCVRFVAWLTSPHTRSHQTDSRVTICRPRFNESAHVRVDMVLVIWFFSSVCISANPAKTINGRLISNRAWGIIRCWVSSPRLLFLSGYPPLSSVSFSLFLSADTIASGDLFIFILCMHNDWQGCGEATCNLRWLCIDFAFTDFVYLEIRTNNKPENSFMCMEIFYRRKWWHAAFFTVPIALKTSPSGSVRWWDYERATRSMILCPPCKLIGAFNVIHNVYFVHSAWCRPSGSPLFKISLFCGVHCMRARAPRKCQRLKTSKEAPKSNGVPQNRSV